MDCVYVVGAYAVLIVVGTICIRIRTRRVAASRPGEAFDTFRAAFASEQAPPEVLRAVYAKFQKWCFDAVAAFPVRADDDISHVYGMVDEDLDEAVLEVLAESGRVPLLGDQSRRLRPVTTVRDFVRFVAACPRAPNQAMGQTVGRDGFP